MPLQVLDHKCGMAFLKICIILWPVTLHDPLNDPLNLYICKGWKCLCEEVCMYLTISIWHSL